MKYRQNKISFTDHTPYAVQLSIPFDEEETAESAAAAPREPNSDSRIRDFANPDRRLFYISLGSGSSGNSCYIGSSSGGIIIDAGIRNDFVEETLKANGIDMRRVKGLLITHDHTDHIKYAYNLLRNNRHIKLFCTPRVLNGILRRHSVSRRIKEYHVPIFKEIPFTVADFRITAFEVPHDGSDNMGFSIEFDSRRFVLATDLGAIADRARFYMSQATYLVIESNYDLRMLLTGPYPEYLKVRIRNGSGHLDNTITAGFLGEIAGHGLQYIFLCHLSQENNIPTLAVKTSREALEARGFRVGDCSERLDQRNADLQLMALPRKEASRLFVFRP